MTTSQRKLNTTPLPSDHSLNKECNLLATKSSRSKQIVNSRKREERGPNPWPPRLPRRAPRIACLFRPHKLINRSALRADRNRARDPCPSRTSRAARLALEDPRTRTERWPQAGRCRNTRTRFRARDTSQRTEPGAATAIPSTLFAPAISMPVEALIITTLVLMTRDSLSARTEYRS